jgi:hypothetical protein
MRLHQGAIGINLRICRLLATCAITTATARFSRSFSTPAPHALRESGSHASLQPVGPSADVAVVRATLRATPRRLLAVPRFETLASGNRYAHAFGQGAAVRAKWEVAHDPPA